MPDFINPWSIYPDVCYGTLNYPENLVVGSDGIIFYNGRCSEGGPHGSSLRSCLSLDDMQSMQILETSSGPVGSGAFSTDGGSAFAFVNSYTGVSVVRFTPDTFNTIINVSGHPMPEWASTAITNNYVYSVFTSGWGTRTYAALKTGPPSTSHMDSTIYSRSNQMQFVNDSIGFNNGYYLGNQSKTALFKTIDLGAEWYPVFIDSINTVRDYHILDTGRGYVCINAGVVFMSEDHGETWLEQGSLPVGDYKAIRFMNDSCGYIAGADGALYKTTDYGVTWTPESISTTANIERLFARGEVVYAYTADKKLFKNSGLVGIKVTEDLASAIEVFPNPSQDQLKVYMSISTDRCLIAIYSSTGQKVMESTLNDGNNHVNVSALNNGMYFYKIFNNNQLISSGKLTILK